MDLDLDLELRTCAESRGRRRAGARGMPALHLMQTGHRGEG